MQNSVVCPKLKQEAKLLLG